MRLAPQFSAIKSFKSQFGTKSIWRRAMSESRTRKSERPRVVLLQNLRKEMSSVEMRRTKRVFEMGKGVDGAQVLRSGLRLLPESSVVKLERTNEDDDWAARILHSILVYMSRSSLKFTKLSQFLVSEPINIVFALPGNNFSWVWGLE